jgi:hypothetical protein
MEADCIDPVWNAARDCINRKFFVFFVQNVRKWAWKYEWRNDLESCVALIAKNESLRKKKP